VIDPTARVHPAAEVEADVEIGPGTVIRARAQVRTGARIGAQCGIGGGTLVDVGVAVGDRVQVHDNALLYAGLTVEDGVFIGPGAIFANERFPRAITTTGDLAEAGDRRVSPITLRHGCTIGAGAVVVAGVVIGRYATVGAGAVVTRDVTGHALVGGVPAHRLGWVCACGRRLAKADGSPAPAEPAHYALDTDLTCESCGRVYGYVPDAETLEERASHRQGAPA
jgi:UDP-2-acetamido-3-amino-2,3-dideoxy-glucuronate N-acetyltransferase